MNTAVSTDQASTLRQEFAERLRRPDGSTYVYTYPFKGAYRPLSESKPARLAWGTPSGPVNIYVHVPYCEMQCGFCNLFTTANHSADTLRSYAEAVCEEASILAGQVDWRRVEIDSVYVGGGTPTLLAITELSHIIQHLRGLFKFHPTAELAIESAPSSIDEIKLEKLLRLGFRRISFGVQSFDEGELRTMGRHHDSGLSTRMVSAAVLAGFDNVNVDLIYGLPHQSLCSWIRNIETASRLGVQTITVYPLTLRERTGFGKRYQAAPQDFPRNDLLYRYYDQAVDLLTSHGYGQNTMATFAKPGGGCRHETNEFNGIPTLGLGASALSYAPTIHYTSGRYFESTPVAPVLADYFSAIEKRELPIRSGIALSKDESQRRHVILGLLYLGVDRDEYRTRFGEALETRFDLELEALRGEGCIDERGTLIALSQRGRRFSSLVVELLASEVVKNLSTSYR